MRQVIMLVCVSICIVAASGGVSCQETSSDATASVSLIQDGTYGNDATFQVGLGDFDNDGDLDAVFSNMDCESQIWMNDGMGMFSNSGQFLGAYAHGVGVGDIDGDLDLDLVFAQATTSFSSQVYKNNGSGRFTPSQHNLRDRAESANAISLFDVDGDGDLDAGVYYANRYNAIYSNDGTGQFERQGTTIPGMAAWGDVDADGDVDAVVQRFEGGYAVHLNRGDGSFEEVAVIDAPTTFLPGSFALGDLDGDSDLDVACASGDFTRTTPLVLLLNDGTGHFSYVPDPQFLTGMSRVSLGDFTGDGALDIFLGSLDRPNVIGINDGAGRFIDAGLWLGGDIMEGTSAIGDLDGDGDLDLFVAIYGQGGPNEVWFTIPSE